MEALARKTIEQFHMCLPNATIVVGVSGGADSVALLHLLCALREEKNWQLQAVHVHHGLRGAEADGDCAFVEGICEAWGVACRVFYFDVREEARKRGLGEEETGRLLRYESFREMAGTEGQIAVAHHQNDQAETILMRLCRGTGLAGLQGMQPMNGDIVRPLLFCSREQIEEYCAQQGLEFCQDSTNLENGYTRNRIRNRVLPELRAVNAQAVAHIAQSASRLAVDEDYLTQEAETLFEGLCVEKGDDLLVLEREALAVLHPAMSSRVLRKSLAYFGETKDISAIHIEILEALLQKESGKSLSLPHGLFAETVYRQLVLRRGQAVTKGFDYPLPMGEDVLIPQAGIVVRLTDGVQNAQNGKYDCTNVFDYDKIDQTIWGRTRRGGDRGSFANGTKKLKDFFIDEKIEREERGEIPLIAFGSQVLWVVGRRVAEAYLADENTTRVLTVQIRRAKIDEGKSGSSDSI